MLLNFAAPQLAPNIVTAPTSTIDRNAILGLTPSQYTGLQQVGDTGYFYGNNKMYEPYTPPSTTNYSGIASLMGYNRPSINPDARYGVVTPQPTFETITIGDQTFRTIDQDVTGFSKSKIDDSDIYEYTPSMAFINANAPRPAPAQTPNVTSFLSTPTTMATPTGNYGAGRFLSGLLGSPITYGLPNGETASDS